MVKNLRRCEYKKTYCLKQKFTPNYGPDNADVAVIEFFSITCVISVSSPVPCLKKAIAENKKMFGLSLKTSPFFC
uniref:Uncharacterized protein n=1 Tax=Klebsiella pneumoniae TaxID=573 RepID=A0A8B0SR78_KLEPN|nr:hypothetical protein [Klebsiella pneumoniae]